MQPIQPSVLSKASRATLSMVLLGLGWVGSLAHAATIVITGTNRGIGLEMVRQYAAAGWTVVGTARNPAAATDLNALAKQYPTMSVEQLDVADTKSIEAFVVRLKGKPIDVLVNNAGTLGDVPKQTIGTLDHDEFNKVMAANTYGALKLSEALKPNLLAGQMKKVFGMTSGLASNEMVGRRGGFYAYRMSKAAVNMGFRALGADWRADGIMVGLIAPGMVETDLLRASGFPGKGITPAESVAGMMKVIESMTLDTNNKAINYGGKPIPW
jgi:NAD(P)-dependent dehydrogenase (short-subunit alcohol dehydrogenase family)